MAILRTNGYTFSCRECGLFAPLRTRRGQALDDELAHNRVVPEGLCTCPMIDGHQHHWIGCDAWPRHLAAMASKNAWPGATP